MLPLLKLCIMRVIQKKGLQAVQIVPLIRDAEKYLQTMGLTPATIKSIVSTFLLWKAMEYFCILQKWKVTISNIILRERALTSP